MCVRVCDCARARARACAGVHVRGCKSVCVCVLRKRGVEDGCVVVCVHVWVCGCVGGGNKGAGAKKNESVSDLIGLRGWSWMLELFEGI